MITKRVPSIAIVVPIFSRFVTLSCRYLTPAIMINTGIVAEAREERFQEQNRQIALALLRSRLWERQEEEKMKTIAGYRSVIGRGMRSEKIRTYNYPQDRITDHRLKKNWGNLESIVEGNLDKVVDLTKTLQ